MNRITRTFLSMMLCLVMAVTMCITFTGNSYAAGTELSSGSTITAVNISSGKEIEDYYTTPAATKYQTYSYYVKMPKKGSLTVYYAASEDGSPYVNVSGNGASYAGQDSSDNLNYKVYYVPDTGTVQLDISCSIGSVVFAVGYAPSTRSVKTGNTYIIGATGYSAISSVTVKAPSKGYLEVRAANGLTGETRTYVKAKGFKDWESLSSTGVSYIGVKKGSYKIRLKGAPVYGLKIKFHKIKETSTRTSKSKAALLKKNSVHKGLITTNDKKVHWYKIKNPKKQNMKLYINGKKMSAGNNSVYNGYVKITVVFPDKKSKTGKLYPGTSDNYTISYDVIGSSKARKGTYRIKLESVGGANGYYTIKWK